MLLDYSAGVALIDRLSLEAVLVLRTLLANTGSVSSGRKGAANWNRTIQPPSVVAQNSELMKLQVHEDPLFLMHRPAKAKVSLLRLPCELAGSFPWRVWISRFLEAYPHDLP